jgi:pimeloyl-ACP methyl ester carboxylesterase
MPYAELQDVRCYYELLGSGDPLLLIPGLGSTCATWDSVAGELSEAFTLIMPELRGVGRSTAKRPARNLSHLVSDLIELLDYLQLDQTHVLGQSLGGIVAQRLAIDHPGRVNRLVLLSTGHRFGEYTREIARLLGNALRYFPRDSYERTFELLGTSPYYLDSHPEAMETKLRRAHNAGTPRKAIIRQLRCLGLNDVAGRDYHILAPTLVLSGDSDSLIPPVYGERMADDIWNATFEVIPQCGHNMFTEKPHVVLPKIKKFLSASPKLVPAIENGWLMMEEMV